MAKPAVSEIENEALSHNLLGQRLGRKGRDTRERILAATERLLAGPPETPISLSAVAREASLGMTTLYLYFSDLTELLLAVLEPIMASSVDAYLTKLREPWPDETLGEHCLAFVRAFYEFWSRNSRILHLRNAMADNNDERMRQFRISSAQTVITLLARQMSETPTAEDPTLQATASVLMTGLERVVTIATDLYMLRIMAGDPSHHIDETLKAEARLLELGIRDRRNARA
jgi:AcrR family transcriptional regulator